MDLPTLALVLFMQIVGVLLGLVYGVRIGQLYERQSAEPASNGAT